MPYASSSTVATKCGARQPERIAPPAAQHAKGQPTQQLTKRAVDLLLQQIEAGKSETLPRRNQRMRSCSQYSCE